MYGRIARRNRERAERRALRLDRPVISVGNVTCGGTGKTPTVEMVARDLLALGRRPAILSRGYGALRGGGDGGKNDEYLLLASNLPDVPHLQGKDRYARGREAVAGGADVLILDDGFQHARLHRDLDLVLLDGIFPFGGGRTLPAGLLREPLGVLSRAGLIGITRSDQVPEDFLAAVEAYLRLRFPATARLQLRADPVQCSTLAGATSGPDALRARKLLAFCGIGNPESFRRQLEALGVVVVDFVCFRDHHEYTAADLERLHRRATQLGVSGVIMTQKDAVKIPADGKTGAWMFLRIAQRIARGEDAYRRALARVLD